MKSRGGDFGCQLLALTHGGERIRPGDARLKVYSYQSGIHELAFAPSAAVRVNSADSPRRPALGGGVVRACRFSGGAAGRPEQADRRFADERVPRRKRWHRQPSGRPGRALKIFGDEAERRAVG